MSCRPRWRGSSWPWPTGSPSSRCSRRRTKEAVNAAQDIRSDERHADVLCVHQLGHGHNMTVHGLPIEWLPSALPLGSPRSSQPHMRSTRRVQPRALFAAIADAVRSPTTVFSRKRLAYREVDERATRFANLLLPPCHDSKGEVRLPRTGSREDHVGLYLHNGHEYLERPSAPTSPVRHRSTSTTAMSPTSAQPAEPRVHGGPRLPRLLCSDAARGVRRFVGNHSWCRWPTARETRSWTVCWTTRALASSSPKRAVDRAGSR